mgnify:CR=1 FL=1
MKYEPHKESRDSMKTNQKKNSTIAFMCNGHIKRVYGFTTRGLHSILNIFYEVSMPVRKCGEKLSRKDE